MLHWEQLVGLSDDQLAALDIALVNLACAADLPGSAGIDQDACATKLDYWAWRVRQYTEPRLPNFRRKRWDYRNSEGYFRALALVTVLQRDLGLRYNPAKIPVDVPLDVADSFIHGALFGEGGTCTSLPVVYAAVGRRLGYPIKLVCTRVKDQPWGHMFARWDDPAGERFNIEGTNHGMGSYPDDQYRTGLFEITPEEEEQGCLLRSKTPRQELANFLCDRAYHSLQDGNRRLGTEAFTHASSLHPEDRLLWNRLCKTMAEWRDDQQRRMPPDFPKVALYPPPSARFPNGLPAEALHNIYYLETVEDLLNDVVLNQQFWWPPRPGQPRRRSPAEAHVEWRPGGRHIRFIYNDPPRRAAGR